ncbi:hypothetical protein RhiXN_04311 [Rhizoctonia solani]|uniref:Mitochondrial distribution and morphology protein 35 n=1 Tax=Rhizoctonia solani TaxID=456999 RepID=A0A8H8NN98_9AGAM|nr:uncharacterized protein RhiXN_04311 [Rhizoctonia solani]QRW16310.1 hypothetical protein RhiXN_04311 [Rhizoctonia solani]
MAESLSAECTPLKHAYDTCFNAWFEGYLEPATSSNNKQPSDPSSRAKKMAAEYEEKCGKLWEGYRECVQRAVKEKGLTELLEQAREEHPLKHPPAPETTEK